MRGRSRIGRAAVAVFALLVSATLGASLATLHDDNTPSMQSRTAPATVAPPSTAAAARAADTELSFTKRIDRAQPPTPAIVTADEGPTVAQVLVFFNVLLSDAPHQAFAPAAQFEAAAAPPVEPPTVAPPPPPDPTSAARTIAPTPVPPTVVAPAPTPIPAPTEAPPPAQAAADVWQDASFTQAVWDGVNARRTELGMAPVAVEPRLQAAAADYASLMSATAWFSHTGPDGTSFVDRITAAGFPFETQLGEVLAMGSDGWPPAGVVQAWIDSPPHREQLLNPAYRLAGLGCAFTREGGALMVRCAMEFAA